MMRSRFIILLSVIFFLTSCATQSSNNNGASAEFSDDAELTEATEDELADSGSGGEAEATNEDEFIEAELEQSLDEPAAQPADQQEQAQVTDELDIETEEAAVPAPVAEAAPVVQPTAELRLMHFQFSPSGDVLNLDINQVVQYRTRFEPSSKQLQIDLMGTQISPRMSPTARASVRSRFTSARAESISSDMVRVIVQTKTAEEPIIQQEGEVLLIMAPSGALTTPLAQSEIKESEGEDQDSWKKKSKTPLGARTLEEFYMTGAKFYGKPLSLQVKDVDVREVLNFVADESGANIIISDDVEGKVSLKLRQIPWDQALVTILRSKRLGYIRTGDVIRISTMKSMQEDVDNARRFMDTQRSVQQQITRVIPVSYANPDTLANQIRGFLTRDRGQVGVDTRTSSVILSDREEVVERLTNLVKELDVPPTQVMIEGKIVEAEERFSRSVGVKWGFNGSDKILSPTAGSNGGPLTFRPNMNSSPLPDGVSGFFSAGFRIGTLDFLGNLDAMLALAESDTIAKILSSPRIVTMNRERAEISQKGEQISVATLSDNMGVKTTRAERTNIQLKLTVTPQITADGSVIMDVEVQREFAGAEADAQTKARPINTRTAKTKVLVRNGQTAVIGGIFQNDSTETENGTPILKDIPVLGWLFKYKGKDSVKNELMIFLTPRILTMRDLAMDSKGS